MCSLGKLQRSCTSHERLWETPRVPQNVPARLHERLKIVQNILFDLCQQIGKDVKVEDV